MIKRNYFILILILFLLIVPFSASAQDSDEKSAENAVDEETMKSWPFSDNSDPDEEDYTSALDEAGMITKDLRCLRRSPVPITT